MRAREARAALWCVVSAWTVNQPDQALRWFHRALRLAQVAAPCPGWPFDPQHVLRSYVRFMEMVVSPFAAHHMPHRFVWLTPSDVAIVDARHDFEWEYEHHDRHGLEPNALPILNE